MEGAPVALVEELVLLWVQDWRSTVSLPTPEECMRLALGLAERAAREGEVPVGAALLSPNGAIFTGRNRCESIGPLDHAEFEAIRSGLAALGRRGLGACTLYVTLEPCVMCLGAMVHARIGGLVYACPEPRFGGVSALQELWRQGRYPHRFPVASGLCEEESRLLLRRFFAEKRP